MRDRVVRCGTVLLAWLACARVYAHGVPPDAYAVLSRDAQGVRAVSLSAGLALRRGPARYQFVCPALWGDQFAAPVAALADGTLVVAASSGLMLLAEDGSIRPHPDPAAAGRSSDLVRSAAGVFALRATAEGSELLAVDAQQVRVLWKDPNMQFSLAALDDKLVLLRENGRMLEQTTLAAASGMVLERQIGAVDLPVDYVFARASAGVPYALVVFRDGTMALGTVRMNVFTKLAEGELSIAGPLSVGSGTLLAQDGALAQLIDGRATPLPDPHNVVCLSQYDGLTYACDTDGIATLNGQVVGDPLFMFSWLSMPDLTQVPEGDTRMRCLQNWSDLRLDLQLIGVTPLEDAAPLAGAAGAVAMAGAGAPLLTAAAGAAAPIAGSAPMAMPVFAQPAPPAQQQSGGCSVFPGGRAPVAAYAFALGCVLALVRMRRRG